MNENLKNGFKINLESHYVNHANSILFFTEKCTVFGYETRYINTIIKEMATAYARLIYQYIFKYHTLFSASFYKITEEDERNDDTDSFINLNKNHNLTESDIKNVDVKSQLEHQVQIQETKESGWIFYKSNSMKIRFYKTGELNGSTYVKILLRSNAILNIENNDKYCFLWSILAYLHTCEKSQPSRVRNFIKNFTELNIEGFDFTNRFRCSYVHVFEKVNNLSIDIFELNFYQHGNKGKHNLIPFEISKNKSDRVVDLIIYKKHYALIKKINVNLGDHHKNLICRRCFNSYTNENALKNHKEKCGDDNLCSIRRSGESHIHWNKHFHKNPLYFRIYADFEADNAIDNSTMGNKTTNIYKQNPVLNRYHIVSELNVILRNGYYESPLG